MLTPPPAGSVPRTPLPDRLFGPHAPLRRVLRRSYYRTRHRWRRLRRRARSAVARVHPRPVFVLGLQKSGTTAVAGLLGRRTGLPTTLDLVEEIQEPCLPRVRAGALSFDAFVRRNRLDFSRALIKEPNLTPFYEELKERFPDSPFVFVVRDPRDAIRSIFNRLRIPGHADPLTPDDLDRFPEVNPVWRHVLDGRWLGLEGDDVVDLLAARWNAYVDLYRAHRAHMLLIRFEDFLVDKTGEIDRLAAALGLEPVAEIAGLLDHPFQPPGDRSLSPCAFFGEDRLGRIERLCAARMAATGYAPYLF